MNAEDVTSISRSVKMARANNYFLDGRKRPYDAYVILTLNCNSKCDHCYLEAAPGRKESMSMELRKKVIDELAYNKIWRIELSGGEPTIETEKLTDTLYYLMGTYRKTGYPKSVGLQTNAYSLKGLNAAEMEKKIAKLKSAGVDDLDITSFDEYHDIDPWQLNKIEKVAKKVFGRDNVSVRGVHIDGLVAPIGRARTKVS